jgi:arylsulfatase A-like enzyme
MRSASTRRDFLRAFAATTVAGALGQRARAAAGGEGKPNVLFIYTDDQREDTVSALGNPHIKTPNLDAVVRGGFVFRNAYCMGGFSAAVCLPSRMMTLRGRGWFRVRNLPQGFANLPTSMKRAGYETFHLGKRGNTDKQVHKLFDHSGYVSRGPEPGKPLADGTIAFLKSRKRDRPFFIYLAGPAPHDPRVAPKAYMDMYEVAKMPLPPNYLPFHPFDNGEMFIRDEKLAPWPRTKDEIRRHLRDYYAMITHLDVQLGRIFQTLKDLGQYDNTIIVFASDQGIAIGSHGLMGKQNLYEGSMGVPMIFAGPGVPKGKESPALAYLFDIFPTVCDLVGAPVPAGLDGKSLAPVIRGQSTGVRDTIFLAYKDLQRAVRRGKWKLLRYPKVNVTQLFDLDADPYETKDLADDLKHAAKVKELLAVMAEQQKLYGDTAPLKVANAKDGRVGLEFFRKPPPKRKKNPKLKPRKRPRKSAD